MDVGKLLLEEPSWDDGVDVLFRLTVCVWFRVICFSVDVCTFKLVEKGIEIGSLSIVNDERLLFE